MQALIAVDNPANWDLHVPGVQVVAARAYVTEPRFSELRGALLFNLCRSYSYQRLGYYVSLLAEARGHRASPSIQTIQDMRSRAFVRIASDELSGLIASALAPIKSGEFTLSVYFGKPTAARYVRLAQALFELFHVPLLRARFVRSRDWQMVHVGVIPASEVPESHREVVADAATAYFSRRRWRRRRKQATRCHLAVLHEPGEKHAPSDMAALRRFARAARSLSVDLEFITREDYGRLAEYDALLIRATTAVEHYTYRFARRAAAEGMVVVDDPTSIVRCTNKVFLAELLDRCGIAAPKTLLVHRDNRQLIAEQVGFPCVLKQPDSAFSVGVVKVESAAELDGELDRLLANSELVVAQEFVRTEYDWRVGVFDGQPLFVCRYHMAHRHWQIAKRDRAGRTSFGRVETMAVEDAPAKVVKTAVEAAGRIGDGLYGVDLKQRGRQTLVIEINDNPNIDAGNEDRCLGSELYERILLGMVERVEQQRAKVR